MFVPEPVTLCLFLATGVQARCQGGNIFLGSYSVRVHDPEPSDWIGPASLCHTVVRGELS